MSTSDVSPSERILQDRLDSGLAQIKSSSKKKKKTKDKKRKRESREPELEEDLYKERKRQRKEKTSIILPEGISGESELDEDNAVTEQDEWETMKKSKKAKDEDTSSEFSVDIDNVPRDITTQSHSKKSKKHNVDTEQQKASKSTKNAQEHPKPAKETRIVPVKVGGLWKLPVLESAQRKPEEIVQTAGAVSTPDTSFAIDSEEDPFDEERENIVASKKHNISTPVFPSGQDGAAPAPSKTKKSSKHSSSTTCSSASTKGKLENGQAILSQAVAAIKTSLPSILESISLPDSITPTHKPARAPKATPKPSGASKSEGESERKNRAKDTPNSWQEYPGKLRGKVESSGDAEVEENIAFSSTYLGTHYSVTLPGFTFRILSLEEGEHFCTAEDPDTQHGFGTNQDPHKSDFRIEAVSVCSVAKGSVQVEMCGMVFEMPEGSMWRVRGGERCVVRECGKGAVVHVTGIRG